MSDTKTNAWKATQAKWLAGMKGARKQSVASRQSSSVSARKVPITLAPVRFIEDEEPKS